MTLFRQDSGLPDFMQAQRDSFRRFIQIGIREELAYFSPIIGKDFQPTLVSHVLGDEGNPPTLYINFCANDYYFKKTAYSPYNALQDLVTYNSALVVPVHVYCKSLGMNKVLPMTFCDFPLMTTYGTFIINGSPRVIVHQIVRCPGVYIKAQFDQKNNRTHLVSFLSAYGSWLRFKTDTQGFFWAYIDNLQKIPATLLLEALGFSITDIESFLSYSHLLGPTIDRVQSNSTDHAIKQLMSLIHPSRPPSIRRGKNFLFNHFFHPRKYSLSDIGRKRVNRKFGMTRPSLHLTLTPEDILAGLDYLLRVESGETRFLDDIDHLKNRRARLAGELIQNQFRLGLTRLERNISRKMNDENLFTRRKVDAALMSLIRVKIVASAFNEFFGSSQLSQFMDQTNPLAELTHKRRLSSLGPGGLHRDRAGLVVRGIHPSYYGRLCPIETPEGKNAGLVASFATYSRLNSDGFLESPYLSVKNDKKKDHGFFLLNAYYEDKAVVASGDINVNQSLVPTRSFREFSDVSPDTIDFLGICPIQFMSVATALIPFLEHDDANRALMGSNMQRQAVPLVVPERAFIGTGLEARVIRDAGATIVAPTSGYVTYVDAQKIEYLTKRTLPYMGKAFDFVSSELDINGIHVGLEPGFDDYKETDLHVEDSLQFETLQLGSQDIEESMFNSFSLLDSAQEFKESNIFVKDEVCESIVVDLQAFQRSNQDTCMHQRPVVNKGDWLQPGDCLADSSSTVGGELALGKNILVAYMPWEGYNFEDAVLVSERLVFDDIYTSIHIERYDISTRRTRAGQEYITANVNKSHNLDEFGVIKVGTWVEPGDTLVGKVSPCQESESSPEARLLRAIFGGAVSDVTETPLTVPNGVTGRILERRMFFEQTNYNSTSKFHESTGSVYIYIVQKRRIQIGDKVAGRHGNKGIISNILPIQDMPFLQDGKPVDMVLNPLGVPSRMNVGQVFECLLGLAAYYLHETIKILPFDELHGKEISRGFVYTKLYETRVLTNQKWLFQPNSPGKSILFDGRTGYPFDQPVTIGYPYILKLVHLVDDKIHARSTGPYSLVTQQPLGGRSKHGGQRLGEMEVWALEGFGAAYTLQELLTLKSDDMKGRNGAFMSVIRGELFPKPRTPESFKVLMCELRALCLHIGIGHVYLEEDKLQKKSKKRQSKETKQLLSN